MIARAISRPARRWLMPTALSIGLPSVSMISTTGMPAAASIARLASVCSRPARITPEGRQDSISYSTFSSRSPR